MSHGTVSSFHLHFSWCFPSQAGFGITQQMGRGAGGGGSGSQLVLWDPGCPQLGCAEVAVDLLACSLEFGAAFLAPAGLVLPQSCRAGDGAGMLPLHGGAAAKKSIKI